MQPLALPTPVSAKALNRTLQRYDPHLRDYLVSGFTFGFDLGIQGDIAIQPAHTCNHASALANPDIAKSKIDREVVLGRIGGPFPLQSQQQVVISPLALIPKREPGKFRLIHDLSFPKGESINSTIPREFTTVHYDSIDNVISLVKRCGERCLMSKSDLSEAFRQIPVSPAQYRYLGFMWDDQIYFDKCLPFGCASSCQIFSALSDALGWVMINEHHAAGISYILDDFFFVSPANSDKCQQDLLNFIRMCGVIGLPIKEEKTQHASTDIVIYGIRINSCEMTASLPPDKLSKARTLLHGLKQKRKTTLRQLQAVIGFLNFACSVVLPGRAFLRRMVDLTRGIQKPHHRIRLNKEARADMCMWLHFLDFHNGKSCFLSDEWEHSDSLKLFTDASGVLGYAAILGDKWFNGKWPVAMQCMHITIKELFPIVVAMEYWGLALANRRIVFMCDNAAVVDIVNKISSKDSLIMTLVRRLVLTTLKYNILFRAKHVPGFTNVVADRLSRFQFQAAFQFAPWLKQEPEQIPQDLIAI